jgi:D-3-phosphoglycerate dehydrogenase
MDRRKRMKILVTPTSFGPNAKSPAKDMLERFASEIVYNPHGRPLQPGELLALLGGVEGVVAGVDFFDASVFAGAPDTLKVVSRYGTGYDRVDVMAAARRGVVVTNTPGVNSESVADLAFALMLAAARRIPALDASVKRGEWPRTTGMELFGKTLGILGLGAIGRAVARRAQGFSMRVLAYDPYMDAEYAGKNGIEPCAFDEAVAAADILSLHMPLTDAMRGCIGAEAISRMKPGAIVVNTARGGLIDEDAAYEALVSGQLGGLGLDAFAMEPPGKNKLLELDNVIATPHAGSSTREATAAMGVMAVRNLMDVLAGKPCGNIITVPGEGK